MRVRLVVTLGPNAFELDSELPLADIEQLLGGFYKQIEDPRTQEEVDRLVERLKASSARLKTAVEETTPTT